MKNRELTTLEQEFKTLYETHIKEINAQITIAREAISKAKAISEQYGIPFGSDITPLAMGYTPESYYEKFGVDEDGDDKLDKNFVSDITGSWPGGEYGGAGWEHSAVC